MSRIEAGIMLVLSCLFFAGSAILKDMNSDPITQIATVTLWLAGVLLAIVGFKALTDKDWQR